MSSTSNSTDASIAYDVAKGFPSRATTLILIGVFGASQVVFGKSRDRPSLMGLTVPGMIVARWLLGPRAPSKRSSSLPLYNSTEIPNLQLREPIPPPPAYSPNPSVPPPPYSGQQIELQTAQANFGDSSASSNLHNS
ncbi:hypothetical protein EDC04DRAFT_2905581 [Pisolithus marmoratus]|nr:hypothetical protein EDC04DRAFT_2905581 [Pisolithus marmoratus]